MDYNDVNRGNHMDANWENFKDKLEYFKQTSDFTDEFKCFLISDVRFDKNKWVWGEMLLEVATEVKNYYASGVVYSFYSWVSMDNNDLKGMLKYSELALDCYMKCEGKQKEQGILSSMNSRVLFYMADYQMDVAYKACKEGIERALKANEMNYYLAFAGNASFILSEIGLIDRAVEQLEQISQLAKNIPMTNLLDIYFELSALQLRLNNLDKAEKYASDATKIIDQGYEAYRVGLISLLGEIAYRRNDITLLDSYLKECDKIIAGSDTKYRALQYYYLGKAHYFIMANQPEKVANYYEKAISCFEENFSGKGVLLKEASNFFEIIGEHEKAFTYLKELTSIQTRMLDYITNISEHEANNILQQFRSVTYEQMYGKLQKISSFGKSIFVSYDQEDIQDQTQLLIKEIFNPDFVSILMLDPMTNCFSSAFTLSNEPFSIEGIIDLDDRDSLVVRMIVDQEEFFNEDVSEEDRRKDKYFPEAIKCRTIKPIFYQNIVNMVLCMGTYEPLGNQKVEISLLEVIGDYVTTAIENARRYNHTLLQIDLDSLTGLYNRSGIMKLGKEYFKEQETSLISVLMLDIDDFKKINDTFGHLVGDEVLRKFAKVLKGSMSSDIQCGRYGGEEFLIFIKNMNLKELEKFAGELCETIENTSLLCGYCVTVSIGGCQSNENRTLFDCIKFADEQCYSSKKSGKNQFQIYDNKI